MGLRLTEQEARRFGVPIPEAEKPKRAPRPTDGYRSKWERLFADELERWKVKGDIRWWKHERVRLVLAKSTKERKGASFMPDFVALDHAGCLVFLEVKGFMREAANVRLKTAADSFPGIRFMLVTREDGDWKYTHYGTEVQ